MVKWAGQKAQIFLIIGLFEVKDLYLYTVENLKAKQSDFTWVLVSAESEDDAWEADPRDGLDIEYYKYRWPKNEQYKRVTYIGPTHLPAGIIHVAQ